MLRGLCFPTPALRTGRHLELTDALRVTPSQTASKAVHLASPQSFFGLQSSQTRHMPSPKPQTKMPPGTGLQRISVSLSFPTRNRKSPAPEPDSKRPHAKTSGQSSGQGSACPESQDPKAPTAERLNWPRGHQSDTRHIHAHKSKRCLVHLQDTRHVHKNPLCTQGRDTGGAICKGKGEQREERKGIGKGGSQSLLLHLQGAPCSPPGFEETVHKHTAGRSLGSCQASCRDNPGHACLGLPGDCSSYKSRGLCSVSLGFLLLLSALLGSSRGISCTKDRRLVLSRGAPTCNCTQFS